MSKKVYLTTPLYYVNAKPHIGHAYTNVLTDTFTRFHRFLGDDVFFLTGTDEHGTKIEKAARDNKQEPKAYVDHMVPQFEALWKALDIRYDYFIRTTDDQHKKVVQNILSDLEKRGEIYKASYKGWYCTPCESFWTKLQLIEGKCPDCHREVHELSEDNYFFKLSKYQDQLIDHIKKNPHFIRPEIRRNEVLGFLKQPLEDLCITRHRSRLSWGIEYPNAKDYVVYVWFDALINYISAVQYTLDKKNFSSHWPADCHFIGKDILRQHAIYWPIMLMACGIELPKTVLAHGWWTLSGAKVSKSRGNIVDPMELVKKYGVDTFRYFLLNEVTLGFDGAFSEDLLRERYVTDLANDLGNLWFRYASMLGKYFEGKVPDVKKISPVSHPMEIEFKTVWKDVKDSMSQYEPRKAMEKIWSLIKEGNTFVEKQKPWVLAKDSSKSEELKLTLIALGERLAHIACLLQPFLPETAGKILTRLGLSEGIILESEKDLDQRFVKSGQKIERGDALFPKLEEVS